MNAPAHFFEFSPEQQVIRLTESNRQLREELEKVKKDKQRLDKIELGTPNILCLCKFDPENMERLSGHLWEVGEKGIGHESLREAIDKYEISSGMDIDRTENTPASGDAPVPEITSKDNLHAELDKLKGKS